MGAGGSAEAAEPPAAAPAAKPRASLPKSYLPLEPTTSVQRRPRLPRPSQLSGDPRP